jgi:hypothetical protein
MQTADCVAIYDWSAPTDPPAWLDLALGCFERVGLKPDVISGELPGGKKKKFRSEKGAREYISSSEPVQSLSLHATQPGYKQLVFGWRMTAAVSWLGNPKTALIAWEASALDRTSVLKELAALLGPAYGIGFNRGFTFGPDLYVYGMVTGYGYGPADRIKSDLVADWFREVLPDGPNRQRNGLLRDLYPLNLLTARHLARPVGDATLESWIGAAEGRGRLEVLFSGQWLWSLDESVITSVRRVLAENGLLIARYSEATGFETA